MSVLTKGKTALLHRVPITRRETVCLLAGSVVTLYAGAGLRPARAQENMLERIKARGYASAGFYNERPAAFVDENRNLTGIFPSIGVEVMKKAIGIDDIQVVLTQWQSLIPGLQAKRYDFIIAGMFITPERCKEVLFTDPFRCTTDSFVFRSDSDSTAKSYADLAKDTSLKLGVVAGATQSVYAVQNGVEEGRLQFYPDGIAGMSSLKTGRIDVWLGPTAGIAAIFDLPAFDESGLKTVAFVPEVGGKPKMGCGGFAFRKEDADLRDVFNRYINEGKKSGELFELVKQWMSRTEFEASLGVTAEAICKG